ncbi:DUF819 family protein [Stigmatella sp. ncwal1]|uniref:DUF819 family protein n=1 Tax=Stigmatella ashevillensis TaxID=2995309 RepID=A0ABT5DJS1_9BACT|nr:DUF819 family protein [Stigmatella ashevillena]MDC0713905.1 DUF819 family protein [Stigmatella ashevillena]
MTAVQVVFFLLFPALAIWIGERFRVAKILGPVTLCYAAGLLCANLPGVKLSSAASMQVSEIAVPLAIPLLLFSANVRVWPKLARPLLISFSLACVAAVLAAGSVSWFFRGETDEWWKIAGMLVGVYVGGTANMAAIGRVLEAHSETFILLNTADLAAGGVYLLFLLTFAQRLLLRFMRPFTASAHPALFEHSGEPLGTWTRHHLRDMGVGFGLAVAIVGVGVGMTQLVLEKVEAGPALLIITTLGIAVSLWKRVHALVGTYELGEYVLLIFCVAMGSLADLRMLSGGSTMLVLFVAVVMGLAIVLHVAFSALLRIDVDSTLVCSTATIYGPALIGPVTAALRNRALVGPGLTLGLAGIALGNYLGLATAWGLRWLAGG